MILPDNSGYVDSALIMEVQQRLERSIVGREEAQRGLDSTLHDVKARKERREELDYYIKRNHLGENMMLAMMPKVIERLGLDPRE